MTARALPSSSSFNPKRAFQVIPTRRGTPAIQERARFQSQTGFSSHSDDSGTPGRPGHGTVSIPNGLFKSFRRRAGFAKEERVQSFNPKRAFQVIPTRRGTPAIQERARFQSQTGFSSHSDDSGTPGRPGHGTVSIPNGLFKSFRRRAGFAKEERVQSFNPKRAFQVIPTRPFTPQINEDILVSIPNGLFKSFRP